MVSRGYQKLGAPGARGVVAQSLRRFTASALLLQRDAMKVVLGVLEVVEDWNQLTLLGQHW